MVVREGGPRGPGPRLSALRFRSVWSRPRRAKRLPARAEGHSAAARPPAARPAASFPSPRAGSCLLRRRLLFFPFPLVAVTRRVSAPSGAPATCVAHANATSAGRGPGAGRGWVGGPLSRCAKTENPERSLGTESPGQSPENNGCFVRGAGFTLTHLAPPQSGPVRSEPGFLPPGGGAQQPLYPDPAGEGGRLGLQISASAWISAHSRQGAPEVSRSCDHLFQQMNCEGDGRGARYRSPNPPSGPAPWPLLPTEREGEARRLLGGFRPTGPSGECHSREFLTLSIWGLKGKVALPPPKTRNISRPSHLLTLPHHPLPASIPPFLFNCPGPPAPPPPLLTPPSHCTHRRRPSSSLLRGPPPSLPPYPNPQSPELPPSPGGLRK